VGAAEGQPISLLSVLHRRCELCSAELMSRSSSISAARALTGVRRYRASYLGSAAHPPAEIGLPPVVVQRRMVRRCGA
jgi:hypothetical protein